MLRFDFENIHPLLDQQHKLVFLHYLIFLNYMPEKIILSKGVAVVESEIPLDDNIIEILRRV